MAQARAEYPNEACGVIVGDREAAAGGRALHYVPTRNEAASPFRYRVHPDDLLRLTIELDDADEVFWGIVHSHVRSPAVPSPTDIGAATYPDALYLLVSLSDDEADPRPASPAFEPGGSSTARSTRSRCRIRHGPAGRRMTPDSSSRSTPTRRPWVGPLIAIGLGVLVVVIGTLGGSRRRQLLDAIVSPPALIRAALVGGCAALGGDPAWPVARSPRRAGRDDVPGDGPRRPARLPGASPPSRRRPAGRSPTRCR